MEEQGKAAEGLSACQCVCRADHDRIKSQVEKQRRRAEQAEKAAEPLRHSIRQLSAEVEAKAEEIRVVRHIALPVSTSPCEMLLQWDTYEGLHYRRDETGAPISVHAKTGQPRV